MIGATSARGKREDVVAGAGCAASRRVWRPIIADFVIVPLREDRHLGIERPHILIEQIVFVIAAKLGERARCFGLRFCDDVFPQLSVRKLPLRRDRTIGVDVVAAMDEKLRRGSLHRRIPPPAVSPDHTKQTLRRSLGAVRKYPTCGSLRTGNERSSKRMR